MLIGLTGDLRLMRNDKNLRIVSELVEKLSDFGCRFPPIPTSTSSKTNIGVASRVAVIT